MIQHVDNVGLAVTDFAVAVDFYRRLGFEGVSNGDGSARLSCGAASLFVFQTDSLDTPAARMLALTTNPPGLDHLSFWVGDVDAEAERLRANGVAIEQEPADQPWGRRTLTLLDPDGNRVWLLGEPRGEPARDKERA